MKSKPFVSASTSLVLLLVSVFLFGCYSPSSKVELDPVIEVYAGMPAAELIAALGKPDEVREPDAAGEGVEIWIYRAISQRFSRDAAPSPPDTVGEGYLSAKLIILEEEAMNSFLLADGKLVAWKTKVKKREY